MKRSGGVILIVLVVLRQAPQATAQRKAMYPDLRTVVPQHVQLVFHQGRDVLRFTNAIANTGDGPWRVRPEHDGASTVAVQEILASDGSVVRERKAGSFEYHPTRRHWHVSDVALFEVHAGSVGGPVVGAASVKVSFCLVDTYRLDGRSATVDREYWDCEGGYQGVSVGWADQYHHSLDGQQLDLTAAPAGDYYLVSVANPSGVFAEQDSRNNAAWVSFALTRPPSGNAKLTVTGHNPCDKGRCGEHPSNR